MQSTLKQMFVKVDVQFYMAVKSVEINYLEDHFLKPLSVLS